MDEDAFRAARAAAVSLGCVFEKALLARCVDCGRARRFQIAERETVLCEAPTIHEDCRRLSEALHRNAGFALHEAHPEQPLPHAKEMKIQCGGLRGAHSVLVPESGGVADVAVLVGELSARFGGFEALPFADIVRAIAAYEGRRRR